MNHFPTENRRSSLPNSIQRWAIPSREEFNSCFVKPQFISHRSTAKCFFFWIISGWWLKKDFFLCFFFVSPNINRIEDLVSSCVNKFIRLFKNASWAIKNSIFCFCGWITSRRFQFNDEIYILKVSSDRWRSPSLKDSSRHRVCHFNYHVSYLAPVQYGNRRSRVTHMGNIDTVDRANLSDFSENE